MFKRKHTEETKRKISLTLKGRRHTEETKKKIKETNKKVLHRHHIYLDGNSNDKILLLTSSKHSQIHQRTYNYLVEIGKIDDYIKWFKEKYGFKNYLEEKNK